MARVPRALESLTRSGRLDRSGIDRFLQEHRFPLQIGRETTFVYRGRASSVRLRHWIYGLPSSQPFIRLRRSNLWYLTLDLPAGSRVEYKLEVVRDGRRDLIRDPLNPLRAYDPFGSNSVCQGVGYETPEWTQPDPDARPGRLEEWSLDSRSFGQRRRVRVYLPALFRPSRSYPLLIAHDGSDYLRFSNLQTVLDNLIDRLEIAPLIVALIDSPDRLSEYAADSRHARFVAEELLPALDERYPLESGTEARGLMGASFGAVAALFTAWTCPDLFGGLLLQSGSFAFSDIGPSHRSKVFDPVVEFMNRFREVPGKPADSVFISCGIYESLIYENRSLLPRLQETGMTVRYTESRDGHNWENWRDRLREGLSFLFPGPLWLVYE